MTPRPIKLHEVRMGDRIRWEHCEGTVIEGAVMAVRFDGREVAVIGIGWASFMEGAVTLLDRPLPPIPTTPGTIVRRKGTGYLYRRNAFEWKSVSIGASLQVEPTRDEFDVLVPEVSA